MFELILKKKTNFNETKRNDIRDSGNGKFSSTLVV